MAITNSNDIYNATRAQDQSVIDQIVAGVLAEIEIKIADNVNKFVYEVANFMTGLEQTQKNRIIDSVICILREKGIRASVNITPNVVQEPAVINPFATAYFNNLNTEVTSLTIKWWTRNAQEYMKTYC